MRSYFGKTLLLAGLTFFSASAHALTPTCQKVQFMANAFPGSGGTDNGTAMGMVKLANSPDAAGFSWSRVFAGRGPDYLNPIPIGKDQWEEYFRLEAPSAISKVEYKDCSIKKSRSGVITSVTYSVDGTHYQRGSNTGTPATLSVTASNLVKGGKQGLPSSAKFFYFKNVAFSVKLSSGESTGITGQAAYESPESGGSSNGGGNLWVNPTSNWPFK